MIRFFNVNNPSVIIFLFLYVLLLNAVMFFHPESFSVVNAQAPFSALFYQITGGLFGNNHYVLAIISIVLVFVQSLMINTLVNNVKLFSTGTYVPAIIYALLASLFREFLFPTPVLLATIFVILAIGKAVKLYKQHHCTGQIFDMGFLLGIASLFYMPFLLLILLLFISLLVMRSFNWREWVAGLLGFLSIYFLTATLYFLTDDLNHFVQQHFLSAGAVPVVFQARTGFYVVAGVSGVIVAIASLTFLMSFLKNTIHIRKFLTLMGWTALLLGLSAMLGNGFSLNHFVALSVPLSIIVSYLFLSIRRAQIANVLHLVWLAVVLFFQYRN